jgi:hypothetical protein
MLSNGWTVKAESQFSSMGFGTRRSLGPYQFLAFYYDRGRKS